MGDFRIEQLGAWLRRANLQEKQLLEVGCGKGEYMSLLQQAGAQRVYGIENAPVSVNEAKNRGLQVERGYMAPGFANPWPESFDGFAIFSFMEHWPDLNGSLRALHNFLNEGAAGLVEVPNFEFIVANGLYSEFTVDHIFYFDRQTLRTVMELNGYEVIAIDAIWHGYILSAQVRKRIPQNPLGFIAKQQLIVEQLQQFVGRFTPADVVVWGAGHQALAVMSLAKLQNKVAHVVDSAPFKQNKYTPGTHLLIKPPASLLLDRPKAILILAAGYSDEVAQTIEQEYPLIGHVAILREEHLEVIRGG
jgi:SAM-dependent methyltransferase